MFVSLRENSARLVKKILPQESRAGRKARIIYKHFKNRGLPGYASIDRILNAYSSKGDIFFIQIGANDGVRVDPLSPYIKRDKWRGVLVEPVKPLYDRLVVNYRNQEGLTFANVAISDRRGHRDFYRLQAPEGDTNGKLPPWYDQLGSFFPEVIYSHKRHISNIEEYLVVDQVACITFKDLLEENKVTRIDLLHIDTEGYDYEIIKSIDFAIARPLIILFEHKHLKIKDYRQCIARLKKHKYQLYRQEGDTIALSKEVLWQLGKVPGK